MYAIASFGLNELDFEYPSGHEHARSPGHDAGLSAAGIYQTSRQGSAVAVYLQLEQIAREIHDKGNLTKQAHRARAPAVILVPLGKRSELPHVFEPLNQMLWKSGQEHLKVAC